MEEVNLIGFFLCSFWQESNSTQMNADERRFFLGGWR